MTVRQSCILHAVPQTGEKRLEIAKAIQALGAADDLRQVEPPTGNLHFEYDPIEEIVHDALKILLKAGFRQDQPRWEKGNGRKSGRWSRGAGLAASSLITARLRGGHHYVPRELFSKQSLRLETRRAFEEAVTGKLSPGDHGWNIEHRDYNKAVLDLWKAFLDEKGIGSRDVTPDQAEEFLDKVKHSHDPQIRDFNAPLRR